MKLYSYVMKFDSGFAPNPYHGYLTLATCKQRIRKKAKVGDFIIGTGSKPRGDQGKLIYIMEVAERLTFEQYSKDKRFISKTPNMHTNMVQQNGDNIYRFEHGEIIQLDSMHSDENGNTLEKHKTKDLSGICVLISSNYVYYGHNSKAIPSRFRNGVEKDVCVKKSGHTILTRENYSKLDEFIAWAFESDSAELKVLGRPSDWIR